jgi:alanyl-tRNA synthetase
MTEKLFYENPYISEYESQIVDIIHEGNKTLLVLDKTPFYPEGGGQPSDLGEIDGIKVLYVFEKDGVIYHEIEKKLAGNKVFCKIDFKRRFDHMQQHSGEHLLSGAILKLFGGNNKGFHLGEEYVTIDIDIENMSEDMICLAEKEANKYIYKNEEICTYMVSKDELSKIHIRKQIKVDEDIRIVEAKDMDCCACCGTHVLRTGEIGVIKVIKTERYKGMTRIYLKCGKRALKDFQNKYEIITKLTRQLSVEENAIIDRIENQNKEIDNLRRELNKIKKRLSEIEVKEIINKEDLKIILRKYTDKGFDDIQLIGTLLGEKKYIAILSSLVDKKILFVNNGDMDINCGKLFKDNIKEYRGKGGGNSTRAQGSFDNEENLVKFSDFLFSIITSK